MNSQLNLSVCVTINGNPAQLNSPSLKDMFSQLALPTTAIAVAINNRVIPSAELAITQLQNGDQIEIIRAVCGG